MTGMLVTITGFSGSGKSTLVNRLEELYPGQYTEAVSTTTRPMRPGEVHGVNYFYVTRDEFGKLLEDGALVEHVEFSGNLYGMSKEEIARRTADGKVATIVVEPQGIPQIREAHDGPLLCVFLDADEQTLFERMVDGRGESEEFARSRIAHDKGHYGTDIQYDLRILSGDLDANVRELHEFIRSRHADVDSSTSRTFPGSQSGGGGE